MRIAGFDWDKRNAYHIWRHRVNFHEVEEAFLDRSILIKKTGKRYMAFGLTESGRYLFIVFNRKKNGVVRVITARDMIAREKRYYAKRKYGK